MDLDLSHGQVLEALVEGIMRGRTAVECKRQDRAAEFGTFYIEDEHDPGCRGIYIPSGLSKLPADGYFVCGVGPFFLGMPAEWLNKISWTSPRAEQKDGSVPTKGFLVSLDRWWKDLKKGADSNGHEPEQGLLL